MTDPSPEASERLDAVEGVNDEEVVDDDVLDDPQEAAKAVIAALPEPDPKVLLELAVAACIEAPLPWHASNGRLYWDDEEPNPFDRAETIIGRFGSDSRGTLNAQYAAQAANAAAALVLAVTSALNKAMESRSQAGRLADAIDTAVESGGCDSPTAAGLKAAVKEWEDSLSNHGVQVTHGPIPRGAGVKHDPDA